MILLSRCARVGFKDGRFAACPPVVDYSRDEQATVAEEITALPHYALITDWLADYAVLREQALACVRQGHYEQSASIQIRNSPYLTVFQICRRTIAPLKLARGQSFSHCRREGTTGQVFPSLSLDLKARLCRRAAEA